MIRHGSGATTCSASGHDEGSRNVRQTSCVLGHNVTVGIAQSGHKNCPNPFNPTTTLRYDLPIRSEVVLTIYDILGRKVRTLVQGIEEPGFKSVVWDGTNDLGEPVSAGVYLYQITSGEFVQTRKMVLLR